MKPNEVVIPAGWGELAHASRGYAELKTGTAVLAFLSEAFVEQVDLLGSVATTRNRPDLAAAAAHVALWSDDIHSDWSRAVSAGAVVVKALQAKPWGQVSGYLRDTDGILVELCTPSPRQMPGAAHTKD